MKSQHRPVFFPNPSDFRSWLEKNHAQASELLVGFYKKDSGKPSITWPESVDQALCFGWIDGIRRRVDNVSYTIRFTPRKPTSTWSAVNIKRVAELTRLGHMQAAGIAAFEKRKEDKSGIYSYEQRKEAQFDNALERRFRASKKAWDFFQVQPAGYRQLMIFRVMSAKRQETRASRLAGLIEASARGRRLDLLKPKSKEEQT